MADHAEDQEDTETSNDGDDGYSQADLGELQDEMRGESPPIFARSSNNPPKCYPNVRDHTNPYSTFRTKLNGQGKDSKGNAYRRYHIHYQARRAFRDNVSFTELTAYRITPGGTTVKDYYNSNNHVPNPKPYYAHFLRMKVKPGSILDYQGYIRYAKPYDVPGGKLTGSRFHGSCTA